MMDKNIYVFQFVSDFDNVRKIKNQLAFNRMIIITVVQVYSSYVGRCVNVYRETRYVCS